MLENGSWSTELRVAAKRLEAAGRVNSSVDLRLEANIAHLPPSLQEHIRSFRPKGISIILPTFKGEARIERALRSLSSQSLDRSLFEIIIVANGMKDKTEQLVEEHCAQHPTLRLLFIETANAGASAARNAGLRFASYQFTTFMDDDDYFSDDYLESMLTIADPYGIALSRVVDFDRLGQSVSPITSQVDEAMNASSESKLTLYSVRGILSMTCAKVAPTAHLMCFDFPEDMTSGEDVVYWAELLIKSGLKPCAARCAATYYREVRQGSVSRRESSFAFSVHDRLAVIDRLSNELGHLEDLNADESSFLMSRYHGQAGFIIRYLKDHPEHYPDYLLLLGKFNCPPEIVADINAKLATTLVISYCFPPSADTSSIVMMKRVASWAKPVRVISNQMTGIRDTDAALVSPINRLIGTHDIISTRPSFSSPKLVQEFSERAAALFQTSAYTSITSIYSRAMWPASHIAAAAIKVAKPGIKWTAEFSDPILLDVKGAPRESFLEQDWLSRTGLYRALVDLGLEQDLNLFKLCELLPFSLADDLVFTNHNQLQYMLNQPWLGSLTKSARLKSRIDPQPLPNAALHKLGINRLKTCKPGVNIGYFGTFYVTRGLRSVLVALKAMPDELRGRVKLHIVSPQSNDLVQAISGMELADVVSLHPAIPYLDCLASFRSMDYLLINDAETAGRKSVNPYLPSKLSDYLASGIPLWALVESGSVLSTISMPTGSIVSPLNDVENYIESLIFMATRG